MKKPMSAFILVIALLFAASVYAEIYKYTDENGQKRWTDDLSQVPKEQRSAVQRIEAEESQPVEAATKQGQRAQPESAGDANTAVPDNSAAGDAAELSRESLEKEKADLDRLYQQLMEERKQIEKLRPEAVNFKTRAELNQRINAFNDRTEQYEAQLSEFNQRVNTFNQKIMSKQSPQKE